MISLHKIVQLLLIVALMQIGYVVSAEKRLHNPDEQCYTGEEVAGNDIWVFKDNYVPVEYHPDPIYLAYMDVAVLFATLLIAFLLIVQKRRNINIGFLAVVTLLYFGIFRGGCICPVGAVANVSIGILHPELIGRATVLLFLLPLIFALISGRVFCTSSCPLGAVQHLLHKKKKFLRLPCWLQKISLISVTLILIATVILALQKNMMLICSLDPYKAIFFTGHAWVKQVLAIINETPTGSAIVWACGIGTWIFLIIVLLIGYWIPRPFCRFICPYGVLLGGISSFAFIQRKVDKERCSFCRQCETICPTGAIKIDKDSKTATLSSFSCVQCNRCSNICKKDAV